METNYLRPSATISDISFLRGVLVLSEAKRVKTPAIDRPWVHTPELSGLFDIHPNRIRSKMRRLFKRELIEGCNCGCRGDIEITDKGWSKLKEDTSWTRFL